MQNPSQLEGDWGSEGVPTWRLWRLDGVVLEQSGVNAQGGSIFPEM